MNPVRYLLFFAGILLISSGCRAQQNDTIPSFIKGKPAIGTRVTDTLPPNDNIRRNGHKTSPYAVDSFGRRLHDPRKATIRSAIFPGLGQIYNRKYWKLPLVWAAVGIPAYTYVYNRTWYQRCQFAISVLDNYEASIGAGGIGVPPPVTGIPDSVLNRVNAVLRPLVSGNQDNALRTYRNEFRKDEDYSVLFFLLFWGLNVVDATVDAHLMYFDVSNNLSMRLQSPSPDFLAPGSRPAGLSLVFDLHKPRFKPYSLR
jgi:hypothetical protein